MNPYIGKTLGSYQIIEQIGRGGMATVFKAYQPSMDRYVALKILPSHFTQDTTFVARFTQEARTLARLEHPHILPVYDYGEQEGITYLVMRYIEAGTLSDLVAQHGPMSLKEVARIMGQVGRALSYAHSQGVIHRDIKPSNVLIDDQGNAFLTDFGIAKIVAGTAQFTGTGVVIGTPAYMAPEQGMGKPLDHRCDIYALGVMLYEMITGRVPFDAETPLAVMMKHVHDPLPLPRYERPDLPEVIERIILKALAKMPEDRFQSAEAMAETLERAVSGLPTDVALPPIPGGPTAVMESLSAEPSPTPEEEETLPPPPVPVAEVQPQAAPPAQPTPVARPRFKVKPWLWVGGAIATVAVIAIIAMLLLSNGGDTEDTVDGEETGLPTQAAILPAGWTHYTNVDFVQALAWQGDELWVGGSGGLLRWDLDNETYTKFGIPDGLASTRVNDVLIDDDGNVWIATDGGINCFDGETWVTFDEMDGVDTPWALSLFQDDDGGIWAGTAYGERGLNYYDGITWGPPPVPSLPLEFPRPRVIAGNEDDGLFVGLDEGGLAYFDGEGWEMYGSDDGLPGDSVEDLLLLDDGGLLASFGYEVVRFDLESGDWESIEPLSGIDTACMVEASDNALWFGGDGGVLRYDPDSGNWQRFEVGTQQIPSWKVTAIVEDGDTFWFGTYDAGAILYDGANWETWAVEDGLGCNEIYAIQQDGSGALWLLHPGSGLSRYDPQRETWQTFGSEEGAVDWPSSPGVDSDGVLWIGEYETLTQYKDGAWQSSSFPYLEDTSIYGLAFDQGDVPWVWAEGAVIHYNQDTDTWITFTDQDHPVLELVNTIVIASDGIVWVGGDTGIVTYDGNSWAVPGGSGDAPQLDVSSIIEIPDHTLWAAADGALYHLAENQWSKYEWPDDWVETMAVGPDGTIWVGSDKLGRFDPSSESWQTYTTNDGLIYPDVKSIYVTPANEVWIGTYGGLCRYIP